MRRETVGIGDIVRAEIFGEELEGEVEAIHVTFKATNGTHYGAQFLSECEIVEDRAPLAACLQRNPADGKVCQKHKGHGGAHWSR
jgi:hypothetical protein